MSEIQEERQAEEQAPETSFDELMSLYTQEEGEFEYTAGEGAKARRFRARRLVNLQEKVEISERAEQFMQYVNGKSAPEAWKPFLKKPIGRKVAGMIIYASSLLVSPRLSQLQCLQMAATAGDALAEIALPLMGLVEENVGIVENEEYLQTKNA